MSAELLEEVGGDRYAVRCCACGELLGLIDGDEQNVWGIVNRLEFTHSVLCRSYGGLVRVDARWLGRYD